MLVLGAWEHDVGMGWIGVHILGIVRRDPGQGILQAAALQLLRAGKALVELAEETRSRPTKSTGDP